MYKRREREQVENIEISVTGFTSHRCKLFHRQSNCPSVRAETPNYSD